MSGCLAAGSGRAIITPAIGTVLMGYYPLRQAANVHDDLTVTAIALSNQDTATILLSATLAVIETSVSDRIRNLISRATGVPAGHILLHATHTHSAPFTANSPGYHALDTNYVGEYLIPGAVKVALKAWNGRKAACLGIGMTHSEVGVNRRERDRNGAVVLGQNPWGCYDPTMTVIALREPGGCPIANLIHYGCHGTGAGANCEMTRDWPGVMIDRLEEESGAMTAFFNGAEGDVGPRLSNGQTTGNLKLALELGAVAALDAVRAWRSIKDWQTAGLGVLADQIDLPNEPPMARSVAEKELADLLGRPESLPEPQRIRKQERLEHILADDKAEIQAASCTTVGQTLVSLGAVALVPFPFELFAQIALRIRAGSPFQHTLCLSVTNGRRFYFPSQDQICLGGYEVWTFKNVDAVALADDADNAAVQESLRLLNKLHETERK